MLKVSPRNGEKGLPAFLLAKLATGPPFPPPLPRLFLVPGGRATGVVAWPKVDGLVEVPDFGTSLVLRKFPRLLKLRLT